MSVQLRTSRSSKKKKKKRHDIRDHLYDVRLEDNSLQIQ